MTHSSLLVMLVEDNLDHAELVKRTLSEHRIACEIIHFHDGQEALDYLMRTGIYAEPALSPRPHVILLDLRLPRVDGLEVIKLVKASEELRPIPIVILTTSEAEKDILRAYENHANSYLVKPVGYEQFVNLMNEFGFYWLGWNMKANL
jgi:CheY-like chemotaxis protein